MKIERHGMRVWDTPLLPTLLLLLSSLPCSYSSTPFPAPTPLRPSLLLLRRKLNAPPFPPPTPLRPSLLLLLSSPSRLLLLSSPSMLLLLSSLPCCYSSHPFPTAAHLLPSLLLLLSSLPCCYSSPPFPAATPLPPSLLLLLSSLPCCYTSLPFLAATPLLPSLMILLSSLPAATHLLPSLLLLLSSLPCCCSSPPFPTAAPLLPSLLLLLSFLPPSYSSPLFPHPTPLLPSLLLLLSSLPCSYSSPPLPFCYSPPPFPDATPLLPSLLLPLSSLPCSYSSTPFPAPTPLRPSLLLLLSALPCTYSSLPFPAPTPLRPSLLLLLSALPCSYSGHEGERDVQHEGEREVKREGERDMTRDESSPSTPAGARADDAQNVRGHGEGGRERRGAELDDQRGVSGRVKARARNAGKKAVAEVESSDEDDSSEEESGSSSGSEEKYDEEEDESDDAESESGSDDDGRRGGRARGARNHRYSGKRGHATGGKAGNGRKRQRRRERAQGKRTESEGPNRHRKERPVVRQDLRFYDEMRTLGHSEDAGPSNRRETVRMKQAATNDPYAALASTSGLGKRASRFQDRSVRENAGQQHDNTLNPAGGGDDLAWGGGLGANEGEAGGVGDWFNDERKVGRSDPATPLPFASAGGNSPLNASGVPIIPSSTTPNDSMQQLFQALQEANRQIAELKAGRGPLVDRGGNGTQLPPLTSISSEQPEPPETPGAVAESAIQGTPITRRHGMPNATNLKLYMEEARTRMCMEAEDHLITFYPSFEKRILVLHEVISEHYVVPLIILKEAMADKTRRDAFKRVYTQWKNERGFYVKRTVLEGLGVPMSGLRAAEIHIDTELKEELWGEFGPSADALLSTWGNAEDSDLPFGNEIFFNAAMDAFGEFAVGNDICLKAYHIAWTILVLSDLLGPFSVFL
ncbi:unnamed protein product [Closterium sp. NIES-65]|nr:unnamed protein product [Closterium sp. NIES-65]